MSIRIEINMPEPDAGYLDQHMAALGFSRSGVSLERTRAAIEDDAVEEMTPPEVKAAIQASAAPEPEKRKPGRPKKIEPAKPEQVLQKLDEAANAEQQAISTGEARVGPEDSAEDQAQDAEDEAAETAGQTELTLDDLRNAMGDYVNKYGMPAAQADGPLLLGQALGPVPEGTKNAQGLVVNKWVMSAVPSDQASLSKCVAAFQGAVTANPFDRTAVS